MDTRNSFTPSMEQPHLSCRSINYLLEHESDSRKKEVYACDLIHKASKLREDAKFRALSNGFSQFLPYRPQAIHKTSMNTALPPLKSVDVAIVTIKNPELLAAKVAFGLDLQTAKPVVERGLHFYEGKFTNRRDLQKDSFVLTVVGEDRNVACSNCVQTLLRVYQPKLLVLIGIAAGNKEKAKIGDVVIAEEIIDYEGGRMEADRTVKRPKQFVIDRMIRTQLADFNNDDPSLNKEFSEGISQLKTRGNVPVDLPTPWTPSIKQGVLLSGEKLRADGAMEELRLDYHDKAYALDMEASGFAQACLSANIPWLVFRGVSDYGDPESKDGAIKNDPTRKHWQPYAAYAAAAIGHAFLATRYRSDVF